MFQSFEERSDPAAVPPRVEAVRALMRERGVDWLVVPHADEYQSEYLPRNAERLLWLTGFTGSAGAAIVGRERAVLFVDGRYTLQLQRVAPIDEQHRPLPADDRGAGRAGEPRQPEQPLRVPGQVFRLVLVGMGHHEPVDAALAHERAHGLHAGRHGGGVGTLFEALEHS